MAAASGGQDCRCQGGLQVPGGVAPPCPCSTTMRNAHPVPPGRDGADMPARGPRDLSRAITDAQQHAAPALGTGWSGW
eukprot:365544-Chlamydomonas_euryale.AAC.4